MIMMAIDEINGVRAFPPFPWPPGYFER